MAIEENTRVFERVKFDEDWPKAGAIDTAMQYANYMVDEMRRRMDATARGHIGVPPAHFTEVTALFESVLNQQGYMIVSNESWKDLDKEVRELIRISSDTAKNSAEVHEKLSQREDELDQALTAIKKLQEDISLLRDEQNSGNSDPQQDTFVVSPCLLSNPYSPTGKPCVISFYHGTSPHFSSEREEIWSNDTGLNAEQARELKEFRSEPEQQDTFVVSQCFLPNPYSSTGEPCVLSHRDDIHSSAKGGEFWAQSAGLTEEQARAMKEFNKRHDSEE